MAYRVLTTSCRITNKNMKTIARSLIAIITMVTVSPSVFAVPPPGNVPDGGATVAMLGLGVAALVATNRFFRKK